MLNALHNHRPASRGASLLWTQKQCLSGKEDRLSERTDQRLVRLSSQVQHTIPCRARRVKKDREREISVLVAVGANCVRPRAFTECPYEDDFLSVGKTCFMEGTPSYTFFICFLTIKSYRFILLRKKGLSHLARPKKSDNK